MAFLVYFLAAAATAAFAVYRYLVWQSQYWRRKGVPGPASRLFYGNVREINQFYEPMPMKIHEWTKEYGKVYGYKEGVRNVLVTSDLDMITEVFVKQFDNFYARRAPPLPQDLDNNPKVNLFESRGARWKRLRGLASPSFSINSLKKIRPIVEDSAIRMVDVMGKRHGAGESFDASRFFSEFTLDTICRLVLGQKESTIFDNPRIDVVQKIFLQSMDRPLFHFAVGVPGAGLSLRNIGKKLNMHTPNPDQNRIFMEIENAVRARVKERETSGAPDASADFIDLFLDSAAEFEYQNRGDFSTQASVAKALTVDEVIAQAVVFLLAGYDTTSNALSYTTWMLSRNPEVMKRCQEEIDEVCTDSSISYEDCQNLRYLDAVCRETLRFFPLAARAVARTCMKDTTVGGYEIDKDTIVMADTFAVHFNKDLWGEDVDEFKPERWLESDRRVAAINFLTFGAGPRLCVGMRLATLEEKIALAHMLRKFDVLADEQVSKLTLMGNLTTTPERVPIKINPRI
ncbi:hypothetical protein PMAYCL1PPCAC_16281 [Pristionchus mayeri]|uniref:Cytochrome P450 n=1 Tax=Pristionchus mayeri TaxID=1317129 RepID=A0AAN5CKF8_9BILA|nr:hypothetical protein PMAYCL1PPCAC_16281 [Pristionchus mayeri]